MTLTAITRSSRPPSILRAGIKVDWTFSVEQGGFHRFLTARKDGWLSYELIQLPDEDDLPPALFVELARMLVEQHEERQALKHRAG
jgi:hypothetical protein